jgi:glycogen synthase
LLRFPLIAVRSPGSRPASAPPGARPDLSEDSFDPWCGHRARKIAVGALAGSRTPVRHNTPRKLRLFRGKGYTSHHGNFSQDRQTTALPDHPTDVLFALVGDVRLSSRALRQLRWLSDDGLTVEVLTFGPPAAGELAPGVGLSVLRRPRGGGPAFFWRAHRLFAAAARQRPARVFHASDLYTLPALSVAAERHGGRLLYDSRELFPFVDATAGRPWTQKAWSALERRYVRRAHAVITVNESIAERLAATYGIERPVVVHNVPSGVAAGGAAALREAPAPAGDRPVVLYQGLFREGRGLRHLITAMTEVPDAQLLLVGDGPLRAELEALARSLLGSRARLLPFTPPDELRALTATADVGVCLLEPITESVRLALPNKLFEYLAAGVPVVVSDLPEMAAVVRRFDVGLVIPHDDATALTAALRQALEDEAARERWRANIPSVFRALDPEADRQRFLAVYRALLR